MTKLELVCGVETKDKSDRITFHVVFKIRLDPVYSLHYFLLHHHFLNKRSIQQTCSKKAKSVFRLKGKNDNQYISYFDYQFNFKCG